ncbi:MAG: cyanophycin synthetase [Candidatus Fermentibacteraceae bacterium]
MKKRVHLIGIRGAGMSALAGWYASLGWEVTGCDRDPGVDGGPAGARVFQGHSTCHLDGQDAVVFSAAIPESSQELMEARRRGITLLRRSEALAELSRECTTLAVSGAHGKTSTTSMTGWILQETGLNPTVFLGGGMTAWNGNFRPGGRLAVVEADEYDRAFLRLSASHAAVTTFDLEHLECYGSPEALEWAFEVFLELTLPGGTVAVPVEKPSLARYAERVGRRVVTCGPGGEYDFVPISPEGWGMKYEYRGVSGSLPAPGIHNLRNAATAVALSHAAGVLPGDAVKALSSWPGVQRRLERLGERGQTVFLSDYAHHPTEMAASLSAVTGAVRGPVDVVFQPHLFSRTAMLHKEMAMALASARKVWVLPVYPSRENPMPGVTSDLIIASSGGHFKQIFEERIPELIKAADASALVFMGAGSVDGMARKAFGGLL